MPAFNPNATCPQTGRKRARRWFPAVQPCEKCGVKPEDTTIARHHKDGDTFNNTASNIQWLCFKCHIAEHDYLRGSQCDQKTPERRAKIRGKRTDTNYRPGDTCPKCGGRLYSVQTFYSRQDGLRYVYIGCPKRYGGCGHRVGSYTVPKAGR